VETSECDINPLSADVEYMILHMTEQQQQQRSPTQRPNGGGRPFFRDNRENYMVADSSGGINNQQPRDKRKSQMGPAANGKFLFHPKKGNDLLQKVSRSSLRERVYTEENFRPFALIFFME